MSIRTHQTNEQFFTFRRKLCSLTKICPFPSRSFVVSHMVSRFCFPKAKIYTPRPPLLAPKMGKLKLIVCMHTNLLTFLCRPTAIPILRKDISPSAVHQPFTGHRTTIASTMFHTDTHSSPEQQKQKGPNVVYMDPFARIDDRQPNSKTKII